MRWHRHSNYHNSREYADDPPDRAGVGQLGMTFAFIMDAVRRRFESLLRNVGPTATTVLKFGDGSSFTMLGLPPLKANSPESIAPPCPFPEADREPAGRSSTGEGGMHWPPNGRRNASANNSVGSSGTTLR